MSLADLVVIAGIGVLSGIVNSIAGGGSLLLFPALLGTGLTPLAANVTNSVAIWPGWLGSVFGLRADLRMQPQRRLVALSIATGAGTAVGSVLLLLTPASAFTIIVPGLLLFASVLVAGQRQVKRLGMRANEARDAGHAGWHPVARAIGMTAAGLYGGYFGGAMGVIMLAFLALTTADQLKRLNALKGGLSLVDSTVSLLIFVWLAPVHWGSVVVAAPAALLGGYLGARVARWMNEEVLRWAVVAVGLTVAAYLFLS